MASYKQIFGIRRGNPLGILAFGSFILAVGSTLLLLIAFFVSSTTEQKLLFGYILLFVMVLAPIPVALLMIWSRNIARVQDIALSKTLAHWKYTPLDFYAPFLPYNVDEVYLHPEGIYFPAQKLRPRSFSSGLKDVVIIRGEPAMLVFYYLFKWRGRSGVVTHTETKEFAIPIPNGRHIEAEDLVEYYKSRRGIPSQFMNDQWTVAWVMGGAMILGTILAVMLVTPVDIQRNREEAQATSTAVAERRATEAFDLSTRLTPILTVIESQVGAWQREARSLPVETWESMEASELRFSSRDNVSRVVYGRCDQDEAFYLFVIEKEASKTTYYRDVVGAYVYSTGDHPYTCPPDYGRVSSVTPLMGDWYYVTLEPSTADVELILTSYAATLEAIRSPTPRP
jgi:hypothetical protein